MSPKKKSKAGACMEADTACTCTCTSSHAALKRIENRRNNKSLGGREVHKAFLMAMHARRRGGREGGREKGVDLAGAREVAQLCLIGTFRHHNHLV